MWKCAFKQALACWRPVEYNARGATDDYDAGARNFSDGHAAQAYAVVHVLKYLLHLNLDANNAAGQPKYPTVIDQLERQAARIATNRVIAGMHFPVDSMAGRMLGVARGEYVVGAVARVPAKKFKGRKFARLGNRRHTCDGLQSVQHGVSQSRSAAGAVSDLLQSTGAIIAPLAFAEVLLAQGASRSGSVNSRRRTKHSPATRAGGHPMPTTLDPGYLTGCFGPYLRYAISTKFKQSSSSNTTAFDHKSFLLFLLVAFKKARTGRRIRQER